MRRDVCSACQLFEVSWVVGSVAREATVVFWARNEPRFVKTMRIKNVKIVLMKRDMTSSNFNA